MSTTPKPYTLDVYSNGVWHGEDEWQFVEPRLRATIEALDAAQAELNKAYAWLDRCSWPDARIDLSQGPLEAQLAISKARVKELEDAVRVARLNDSERDRLADADRLIERQSSLLTTAVNVLRGTPPEDTLWSHHDVADLARGWVDRAHAAESERDQWKARAELKLMQRDAAEARADKAEAFKKFVHDRLDAMEVPKEFPGGVHTKEGCRIGDRLDWVMERLASEARMRALLDQAQALCRGVLDGDGEGINKRTSALLAQVQAALSTPVSGAAHHAVGPSSTIFRIDADWLAARDRRTWERAAKAQRELGAVTSQDQTPLVEFKPEGET